MQCVHNHSEKEIMFYGCETNPMNQPIDEKCCEKCWDLSLSDDTRTCFVTDCPCHQTESIEWEKEVNDFRNGVQDAPDTDEYIRENLPRVLSQAITTAVAKRDAYLVEEVKALNVKDGVFINVSESSEYREGFGRAKRQVLSIFKH